MKTFQVDENGYYGRFGGAYVPEILYRCVKNLQDNYLTVMQSEAFRREFDQLLRDYVGRPSPLYFARRLSERYGCRIYLKREDLNHTGAHKINNTIGQDSDRATDGQNPYHRRNGRRAARCGYRYGLRA